MTEQDAAAFNEDDDELCQLYNLANTILDEWKLALERKNAVHLSDLDTTIHQFQEALGRRLASQSLRSRFPRGLVAAPATRFSLTQQLQDHLQQSLVLCGEVVSEWDYVSMGTRGQTQHDVSGRFVFIVGLSL